MQRNSTPGQLENPVAIESRSFGHQDKATASHEAPSQAFKGSPVAALLRADPSARRRDSFSFPCGAATLVRPARPLSLLLTGQGSHDDDAASACTRRHDTNAGLGTVHDVRLAS